MNIIEVRKELYNWGKFWHNYESNQLGYGSNSSTSRICETLEAKLFSVGTANQVADRAESIKVPACVEAVDEAIKTLSKKQILCLKLLYKNAIEQSKIMKYRRDYTTDMAEQKLIGLL